MEIVDTSPISLATSMLVFGAVGAGIAAMTGRRLLAIRLGLVEVAALAGMVVWTVLP